MYIDAAKVGLYYDKDYQILCDTAIELSPESLKVPQVGGFISYENVTSIGQSQDSLLLFLKSVNQIDDDDLG